jgi:hypothetical protein
MTGAINTLLTHAALSQPLVFKVPGVCVTHKIPSLQIRLLNSDARNQFPAFEAL